MKDVLSLTTFAIGALCFVVFVTTVSRMLSVRSRRRASPSIAKCRLWCVNRRGVPTPARSGRRPTPKSINANSCHSILAAHVHCRFASVAPDVLRLAMVCLEPPITSFRLDQAVHPGWGT